MVDRRFFISSSLALCAYPLLSGCATCRPLPPGHCSQARPSSLVPGALANNTRESSLIVDVHTHIFNAHDVPLEDYFTRPVLHLPKVVADLVKMLVQASGFTPLLRTLAPCASDEYAELCELTAPQTDAMGPSVEERVRSSISQQDEKFASSLMKYVNDPEFRSLYRRLQNEERAGSESLAVPVPEDQHISEEEVLASLDADANALGLASKVAGVWRFLRRIASSRYQNAFYIMDLYGGPSAPVDLFVIATVDFDSSLRPSRQSTSVRDQARLMGLISELTDRRILPMVGYDPRRDVASDGAALEDVQQAIEDFGHLGVKLYPPMGFAPLGNADFDGFSACEWPRSDSTYGKKLDDRLSELYKYTVNQGAPILAHSSESNGILRACQANGSPASWEPAFDAFGDLRVCAGHFGGLSDDDSKISDRMRAFVQAIKQQPDAEYYVDLSFLPAVFDTESDLGKEFAQLLQMDLGHGTFADHVVFGTDWYMLAQHETERDYVVKVSTYLSSLGLSDKIMRDNPSRYLNLEGYVERLKRNSNPDALTEPQLPHWADKLPA